MNSKYLEASKMGLKVIHIDRKKLGLENEARLLWENILKPNWEKRAIARGEKLKAVLINERKNLAQDSLVKIKR